VSEETYFRMCSCGCKQALVKKDGTPRFDAKRWASEECLKLDQRNRLAAKRAKAARRPLPRLRINGKEIEGNLPALMQALREQGHEVKIIRPKRAKKAKA
jgi:hypothetical protein